MASRAFRKGLLERPVSPEQLDQLVRVTSPSAWAAVVVLAALIAAALLWGRFGSVSEELAGDGVLQSERANFVVGSEDDWKSFSAILFIPGDYYRKIQIGMEGQMLPAGLKSQEYGYIVGRVREVRRIDRDGKPWTRVSLTIEHNPGQPSLFRWSLSAGPEWQASKKSEIYGKIIVGTEHPLSILFSRFRQ